MGKRDVSSAAGVEHDSSGGYGATLARMARTLFCIGSCVAAGAISAGLSPHDDWYAAIRKPTWMPSDWIFGVVWIVLYAMMGLAVSLVLARGWQASGVRQATLVFATQLMLNFAWSPVFFRWHSAGGALLVIVALWLMVGWTVAAFWSVRDVAGALLLPYWAWVTFAVALNAAIWRIN